LVVALIVIGAFCAVFRPPGWVGGGLFLTVTAVSVGIALVTVRNLVREDGRAVAAARARRREPRQPAPPPPAKSRLFRRVVVLGGTFGLAVLIAGLVAHVAALAIVGGALFLLFLADTAFISPLQQARRISRKTS
jgi:hypothetical protein